MNKLNAVGWFDIYVNNIERAVVFYEKVLNLKLQKINDPTGETQMMSFPSDMTTYGAAGALVKSPYAGPGVGGTMVYFNVADCSENEPLITKQGGKIVRSKFSIGEFGWVTICQDTEGNLFGLNSMK